MTAWTTWLGALVAMLALAIAPAARAACAARCGSIAAPASVAKAQHAALSDSVAADPHAHHHPAPASDAGATNETPAAGVQPVRCAPADASGCADVRDAPSMAAGRPADDDVALAAITTTVPAVTRLARIALTPAQAIRPPGPLAAPLPLRI